MTIDFILDGADVSCRVRATDRLSDVLASEFPKASVGSDCRAGRCGRCLLLMDGKLVLACMVPAFRARGAEIVSPKAYALTEEGEAVAAGFEKAGVATCAFCTPQRILIAGLLLEEAAGATDARILEAMQTVQCRCVEPSALVQGVRAAVEIRAARNWHRAR
ncbi:MAG: hypothetical protein JXA15_07535 [Spirochaetales bacterium]|nr:hypothetical protein [Spirochaetales bacterium]